MLVAANSSIDVVDNTERQRMINQALNPSYYPISPNTDSDILHHTFMSKERDVANDVIVRNFRQENDPWRPKKQKTATAATPSNTPATPAGGYNTGGSGGNGPDGGGGGTPGGTGGSGSITPSTTGSGASSSGASIGPSATGGGSGSGGTTLTTPDYGDLGDPLTMTPRVANLTDRDPSSVFLTGASGASGAFGTAATAFGTAATSHHSNRHAHDMHTTTEHASSKHGFENKIVRDLFFEYEHQGQAHPESGEHHVGTTSGNEQARHVASNAHETHRQSVNNAIHRPTAAVREVREEISDELTFSENRDVTRKSFAALSSTQSGDPESHQVEKLFVPVSGISPEISAVLTARDRAPRRATHGETSLPVFGAMPLMRLNETFEDEDTTNYHHLSDPVPHFDVFRPTDSTASLQPGYFASTSTATTLRHAPTASPKAVPKAAPKNRPGYITVPSRFMGPAKPPVIPQPTNKSPKASRWNRN